MASPERQIKPTDRRISGYTIALGVVGFLALSAGFFFLGMFCIGPWFKEHMKSTPRIPRVTVRAPAPPAPRVEVRNEAPADTAGQADGSLDVQVTEEGQNPTGDGSQIGNGVKQDDSGLTVTLEPNGQQNADETGTSEEAAKPAESPASRSHVDRPKPDAASESAPTTHASSPSSGGRARYRVQTGTFATRSNADALARDLRSHGYSPDIRTVQGEAGTLYRVEVGEYKTRQGAQDLVDELSGKGYSPSVTSSR